MTGPGERWRVSHRSPVTLADVIDHYQRLKALNEAIDYTFLDPRDEQSQLRRQYMTSMQRLLVDVVNYVPANEQDRRQALANIHSDPDIGPWSGQTWNSLNQYWTSARTELDHSIAAVAGVPLLLSMVRERDHRITAMRRSHEALTARYEAELDDLRNAYLAQTQEMAELEERVYGPTGVGSSARRDGPEVIGPISDRARVLDSTAVPGQQGVLEAPTVPMIPVVDGGEQFAAPQVRSGPSSDLLDAALPPALAGGVSWESGVLSAGQEPDHGADAGWTIDNVALSAPPSVPGQDTDAGVDQ